MSECTVRTSIAVYRNLDQWIGKIAKLDLSAQRLWRMVLDLPEGTIFVSLARSGGNELSEIVHRFEQNEREAR